VTFREFVALGDSMTAGGQGAASGEEPRSWVDCFVEKMQRDNPSFHAVNLAATGKKLADVIAEQLDPALGLAPDLVSVMVGANDLRLNRRWKPEVFEADLRRLMERLAGDRVRLLGTVPDFAPSLPFSTIEIKRSIQRSIRAANAVIAAVAADVGALLVDLHSHPETYDLDNYSADGLHPSARGHEVIGGKVFEVVMRAHGASRAATA
jgi:lysophospholipase L1-like esterase